MDALGWIILGVIVVVGFSAFGNQITADLTALQNSEVTSTNAKTLAPNTSATGSVVCDLKITLTPTLTDQEALAVVNDFQWQMNNFAQYSWFNCVVVSGGTQPVLQSLVTPQVNNLYYQLGTSVNQKLNVISTGQTVHLYLTVVNGITGVAQVSYQTNPFLVQTINIPAGIANLPTQYSYDFVVYNIPRTLYNVEVSSDIPINGGLTGAPITISVQP